MFENWTLSRSGAVIIVLVLLTVSIGVVWWVNSSSSSVITVDKLVGDYSYEENDKVEVRGTLTPDVFDWLSAYGLEGEEHSILISYPDEGDYPDEWLWQEVVVEGEILMKLYDTHSYLITVNNARLVE